MASKQPCGHTALYRPTEPQVIADLRKQISELQIDLDIANEARKDALETLAEFQGFDGDEDLWAAMKQERDKLRRILAHVPGKIAIKAKEAAGYPNYILTAKDGK